jgi:hypothetical protein
LSLGVDQAILVARSGRPSGCRGPAITLVALQQLDACLRDHRLTSSAPPPAISKDAKRSMILFDTNLS